MSSTTIYYHYVYRITNKILNKHYYGVRTSKNIIPQNDLGVKYFSSSLDKEFKKDQKQNPQNYKYKVIKIFTSRKEAINLEIKLHNKFDVGVNVNFYNKAKQSSIGFDTTGLPGTFIGKSHTEESKKKISIAATGRPSPMKGIKTGRTMSEENRRKMSERTKGKPSGNTGKKISEETRKKISIASTGRPGPNKGKKLSDEQKLKISKLHKGIPKTLEAKIKNALSHSKDGLTQFNIIINFNHNIFGDINCTAYELTIKYPEFNFIPNTLVDLYRGKVKSHRGWTTNKHL